jgi:SAM-dependent methyltransferase/uncharacterized protein YbaR (Trm112 family)
VQPAALDVLRCPACVTAFELRGSAGGDGLLCCAEGHEFAVADGFPSLVHPATLLPSDAEFQTKYDATASEYDTGLDWLFRAFRAEESQVRESLVDLLDVEPGARVLETGCGTGRDSQVILDRVGASGSLYALDISRAMLEMTRAKLHERPGNVEYVHANASFLPFADDAFDAAFHFGGINTFGDVRRALQEVNRVVRVGGKVVFGDEGMAPWLAERDFGRVLINANPLYRNDPPLDHLPETAADVRVQWILEGAFYVVDFRVADDAAYVDVDLPIPGKGDTLRSRYTESRR